VTVLVLMLLALAGCSSAEEKAVKQAANFARADIDRLADRMGGALARTTDPAAAVQAAREATGSGVFNVMVIDATGLGDAVTVEIGVTQRSTASEASPPRLWLCGSVPGSPAGSGSGGSALPT
jgi:hypothetical protein